MANGITFSGITELDKWLDEKVSPVYKDQPLAQDWARISKIGEEYGEVVDVFIGITGQNPRKGIYGDYLDLFNELIDTALTGILALQHFTKDEEVTRSLIAARCAYRLNKAGLV